MTRSGGSIRGGAPRAPRPAVPRDPYGIGPLASWIAPVLALVGLLLVGWLTWGLVTGDLRLPGNRPGSGNNPGGGTRTPAPSNIVVVPTDPRANVPGSIVYVKGGNVWIQSGTSGRQVTRTGTASQPAWSADGAWIYYVETREEMGLFPAQGNPRRYVMPVPTIMRVRPDGGEPEAVATGRITPGRFTWFHWLRQPTPHPDGSSLAVVSDGPDPTQRNVILQILDLESGEYSVPAVPETAPLGHQDPAWRPDGRLLLVVRNGRDGSRGAPMIMRWNPANERAAAFSGPGYLSPSWSRDQRWVAATRTTNFGTDIVILDGGSGAEVFRVTDDGRSWSPVWSPFGDGIAFLHQDGGIVDLRLVKLTGSGPDWQVADTIPLTEVSGLEAISRPGWFVPASELPALPTPAPSGVAPGSGSPASPAPASAAP